MAFAGATFRFCRTLPMTDEAQHIARQLRRSASSVAANCRATRRSQSDKVFAAKVGVVIEEADEAGFWLELLVKVDLAKKEAVSMLQSEANELVAIFTASKKTICARIQNAKLGKKKPEAKN